LLSISIANNHLFLYYISLSALNKNQPIRIPVIIFQ